MPPASITLPSVVRRFIEDAGNTTQSLGIGRVLGQIYAFLYFSREARCLADMQAALGISKGSASMGVRQLEQWNAVRQVWVRGDRKDYYEANDWFGEIVRNILRDTVGKKLASSTGLLDELRAELNARGNGAEEADRAFIENRLDRLKAFHAKAQRTWNSRMVKMLLR